MGFEDAYQEFRKLVFPDIRTEVLLHQRYFWESYPIDLKCLKQWDDSEKELLGNNDLTIGWVPDDIQDRFFKLLKQKKRSGLPVFSKLAHAFIVGGTKFKINPQEFTMDLSLPNRWKRLEYCLSRNPDFIYNSDIMGTLLSLRESATKSRKDRIIFKRIWSELGKIGGQGSKKKEIAISDECKDKTFFAIHLKILSENFLEDGAYQDLVDENPKWLRGRKKSSIRDYYNERLPYFASVCNGKAKLDAIVKRCSKLI